MTTPRMKFFLATRTAVCFVWMTAAGNDGGRNFPAVESSSLPPLRFFGHTALPLLSWLFAGQGTTANLSMLSALPARSSTHCRCQVAVALHRSSADFKTELTCLFWHFPQMDGCSVISRNRILQARGFSGPGFAMMFSTPDL